MSQLDNLTKVSNIQKALDDTVVLLLTMKGSSDYDLLQKQRIDDLIRELQHCSRSLPSLIVNNNSISKEVYKVIGKATTLWSELFKGSG